MYAGVGDKAGVGKEGVNIEAGYHVLYLSHGLLNSLALPLLLKGLAGKSRVLYSYSTKSLSFYFLSLKLSTLFYRAA